MRFQRMVGIAVLAFSTLNVDAHPQPATLISFDIASDHAGAEVHLPLPELELAFGHAVTTQPLPAWEAAFRDYLRAHFGLTTASGQPWRVSTLSLRVKDGEQIQTDSFRELILHLRLTPPAGGSLRDFVLHNDMILHQVVTHKALVSIRSHWKAGQLEPVMAGSIFVDTANGQIAPLRIKTEEGGWLQGARATLAMGMRHISEGADHLLFLLVLLLPATLRVQSSRWGAFAGYRQSLWRLLRIVTAFTLGHSLTLTAGALEWVKLPQQPVEVFIAISVLVTSLHAIRPLFLGREGLVAALFGLVHGLAFATVLAELHLEGSALAVSILGFNVGIELMQIAVVALTVPWLFILSLTPAHRYVRVGGASLAALAACGWIWNRVTGQTNIIERTMAMMADFAPLGIFVLAMIAIPAYWRTTKVAEPSFVSEGSN